jgi:hypothetical protein
MQLQDNCRFLVDFGEDGIPPLLQIEPVVAEDQRPRMRRRLELAGTKANMRSPRRRARAGTAPPKHASAPAG